MQAISGKASSPVARDNRPISIFAKEGNGPTGADTVKPKTRRGAVQVALTNAVGSGTVEPLIPEPTDSGTPASAPEAAQSDLSSAQLAPATAEATVDVAALRAQLQAANEQRKQLREQLKQARASQPKAAERDRLAEVIARQNESFNPHSAPQFGTFGEY